MSSTETMKPVPASSVGATDSASRRAPDGVTQSTSMRCVTAAGAAPASLAPAKLPPMDVAPVHVPAVTVPAVNVSSADALHGGAVPGSGRDAVTASPHRSAAGNGGR